MERTVFITGAAQGIGAAIAAAFHKAGDNLALLDRSDSIAAIAKGFDPSGRRVLPLVADIDDEESFKAAFAAAIERFGSVGVMINNAARTATQSIWDITAPEWDAVMATNLRGTFLGCRIAGAHMRDRRGGRIINLSSIAGQRGGTATGLHYAASKAGILVMTKVFAQELARHQVTVNAIAPAAIAGPMVDALDPATRENLKKAIPVGRFGFDREVAAAALYLASDDAGYVTGATFDINGGLFMR